MPLEHLDHVNIRTASLAPLSRFYEAVLGLPRGPRPPFDFGGAWHYLGERAAVHLVEVARTPAPEDVRLEHFAFRARGLNDFVAGLEREGVKYRLARVPDTDTLQVHLHDPDGNHIEVQFAASVEQD